MIKLSEIDENIKQNHMWLKHELWEIWHKMKDDEILERIYRLEKLIKEQPKIATDTNVGCKWIPCSERLPDETDYPEQHFRILASCSDGIVRNATIKSLRQTEEKHMNRGYYFTYVAWMPLPEPMGEK